MSDAKEKNPFPSVLPDSVVDLLVSDVFRKNGISTETKKKLSEEQKESVRSLVHDLSRQVQEFVEQNKGASNKTTK